jgi:5-methylcytosine-specific restriction endonuclease McrA
MRLGYYYKEKEAETYPDYGKGKCLCCGVELVGRQRKYCSHGCGQEYYEATSTEIMISWATFRDRIIQKAGHCKGKCGNRAQTVHHIHPIAEGGKEFDESNCIALCDSCHLDAHRKRFKRKKTNEEDVLFKLFLDSNRTFLTQKNLLEFEEVDHGER